MSDFQRPRFDFQAGPFRFCLGPQTKIMGVLNVTPDSFSDGGRYFAPALAEKQALRLQDEGAHFLDIGGESSRPGSRPVPAREEIRRVVPVLKRLRKKIKIPVSVDTAKSEVAHAALDEGAVIINDISALADKRMAQLIARYGASVVLMHMQGSPQDMQKKPRYRAVLKEVKAHLRRSVQKALDAGIERTKIAVDPGFGFGKTTEHNFELLSGLEELSSLGLPTLVGLSRKSFIGRILGAPVEERLVGSLAAASVAIQRGAHILRVHDVAAHRQLAMLVDHAMSVG